MANELAMIELPEKAALQSVVGCLLAEAQKEDFCGYDPFDGLNSSAFKKSGLDKSRLASIAWLQFHKRSSVNLRPFVGIRKDRNPKGIALFVLGLVALYESSKNDSYLELASELGDWLLNASAEKALWGHYAWGYHFDWAARAFYVPKGKPNAITTCYVARSLFELGRVTALCKYVDAAVDAGRFLDGLYIENGNERYFAYIPGEATFVHNANLWTAAMVAKSATYSDSARMADRAICAARQTVSMQRGDGAWEYGTRSHHGFIDGFHTGYNLEALSLIRSTLKIREFDWAIDNGLNFYRANFILEDGTVKYYNDCQWPLDTHSFAEAVLALLNVSGLPEDLALARRVIKKALDILYLEKKNRFIYQKWRFIENRCSYMRWTQAWAFYALSEFIRRCECVKGEIDVAF